MYPYVHGTYWYIPFCTTFVSILKGTSLFILTSSQYVLLTSGFFCAPPGQPVCLPAIYAPAHPLSRITLKQVQVHSLLLAATLGGGGRGGRRRRWRHWQVHCSGLRRRWRLQVCCIRLDQGQRVCCRALGLRCHSGTSPRQ